MGIPMIERKNSLIEGLKPQKEFHMKVISTLLFFVSALLIPLGTLFANGQEARRGGEAVELLWYGIGGEAADIPDVFAEVSGYLADTGRDYSIRYERFGWADYNQKMQLVLAAGERADIVFMASWAGNYTGNAASGYLTELDELLESQPELKASMGPKFWDAARVDGSIYAVPNFKDMVFQAYIAIDKALTDAYDIQVPDNLTFSSITPILEEFSALKTGVPAIEMSILPPFRGDFPLGVLVPVALSFAEPEKGFQVLTEMREFQEYTRLMRDWTEKGYRHKDSYLNRNNDEKTKKWFLNYYQGFPGAKALIAQSRGREIEARFLNAPPVLDNAGPLGAMQSIPASSPNAERAMDFLALLNTDTALRTMVSYGVEGVHYNLDDNDQVVPTEKGLNNYEMPHFAMGSLLVLKTLQGEPMDARERLRSFNDEAEASPAMGFPLDKEKYSQVIAQVTAVSSAYMDAAAWGLRPAEETIEEFRGKLRELGWFEVVEEINRSYTEWRR